MGLATPLAAPARGWDQLDLFADTKPKEGHAFGVLPPRNSLLREREDCGLLPRRQAGLRLGTPTTMWPRLTSPSVSPAPLPGPGLDLATPLAAPARGWDWLDLLADAKPKRATHGGPAAPKQSSEGA